MCPRKRRCQLCRLGLGNTHGHHGGCSNLACCFPKRCVRVPHVFILARLLQLVLSSTGELGTCTRSGALCWAVHRQSARAPSLANWGELSHAQVMRATLVLCLCKLGLVTRTSRLSSKVDHAPLSLCLFSPAHASGSQNP